MTPNHEVTVVTAWNCLCAETDSAGRPYGAPEVIV